MKIHNVRLGFATNSSSVHSVILTPKNLYDRVPNHEFGWQEFVCVSPNAKMRYCAQQVYINLLPSLGEETSLYVIKGMFPSLFSLASGNDPTTIQKDIQDGYVDHQSRWAFPYKHGRLDMDFVSKFCNEIINYNLAIVGGNDNSYSHDYVYKPEEHDGRTEKEWGIDRSTDWSLFGKRDKFPMFLDPGDTYCDENGKIYNKPDDIVSKTRHGEWVLFNRDTGTKIRLSLNDLYNEREHMGAGLELVDLKITNNCYSGCSFCYQNSVPNGKEASIGEIDEIIKLLAWGKVFEVALGGGDPTTHLYFPEIVRSFREHGIVPSFSASHLDWAEDKATRRAVGHYCGAFALSTQDPSMVEKAVSVSERLKTYDRKYGCKACIHYVMGLSPLDNLVEMINSCGKFYGIGIVLLGWKSRGRVEGQTPPYDYSNWLSVIKDAYDNSKYWRPEVAIDTPLAMDLSEKNEDFSMPDISPILYDTVEGYTSVYIDAVDKVVADSSYTSRRTTYEDVSDIKEILKYTLESD